MHCCPLLVQPIEEREEDTLLDERLLEGSGRSDDEGLLDEAMLEEITLEETRLEETAEAEEPPGLQIVPVTTGVSAAPLVLTCIPKDTVCPGWMLPFQFRLEAE